MLKPALAALPLLAASLAAQSVVSPAHFTATEGNSYARDPFGNIYSPYRYIQVHDDMKGRAMKISGLALRLDGGRTNSYAKFTILCDLLVSTASTLGAAPDKTFDKNHGKDKKQVAGFHQVNFPAAGPGNIPRPFVYKVPFTTPFTFGGQAGLCWEAKISVRQNTSSVLFDGVSRSQSNPRLVVARSGSGCITTGLRTACYLTGSSSMNWSGRSGTMIFTGYRGPKGGTGLLMIGRRDDNFGGIPLPFELRGTAQAPSKTCRLYVAPFLFLPAFFNSVGSFTLKLGFTVEPWFNGLNTYSQFAAVDAKANSWGVILSDKLNHHFLAPWKKAGVGCVQSKTSGPTGTIYNNFGLVVQFY